MTAPRDGATAPEARALPGIVVLGSASRDLVDDDPRGWRLGGGATYSALATARLGWPTAALIGVDAEASVAHELDLLREAGVDLHLARLERAPVFVNIERPTGRVQECIEPGLPLPLDALPAAWASAEAWMLAPVAREVDDRWAAVLPDSAFVTVGWQGLLRDLSAGRRVARRAPESSALVGRADLVGVSEGDLPDGFDLDEVAAMLRAGARLLVTRGGAGGHLVAVADHGESHKVAAYEATPADRHVDPTGAGDTFLAALMVSALEGAFDLAFAAAAGSLVVEGHGLSAVPTRAAVRARLGGGARSPGS